MATLSRTELVPARDSLFERREAVPQTSRSIFFTNRSEIGQLSWYSLEARDVPYLSQPAKLRVSHQPSPLSRFPTVQYHAELDIYRGHTRFLEVFRKAEKTVGVQGINAERAGLTTFKLASLLAVYDSNLAFELGGYFELFREVAEHSATEPVDSPVRTE